MVFDGLKTLVFLLAMLAVSSAASAQQAPPPQAQAASGSGRHGVGFGFGDAILAGNANTDFSSGIGFNLNYDFESGKIWGLLVNLHWNNHSNPDNSSDSLSIKGLNPNVKLNAISFERATLYGFMGLGIYQVSETLSGQSSSLFLFGLDAGIGLNIDIDSHFRFGPSLGYTRIMPGTDNSNTGSTTADGASSSASSTSSGGLTLGGPMFEFMFNVMYFF